jgi:hypothetical protein
VALERRWLHSHVGAVGTMNSVPPYGLREDIKIKRKMMSKTRKIVGVLLVLGLAFMNAWQYWLKPAPAAPELTMITLTGENINLQALKGKPGISKLLDNKLWIMFS